MNTQTKSPLEAMLCFDVYAVNLAFGRLYKPLLDPLGLTYPQYLVLMTLWGQDSLSVGQIGAELGLDSSTLTPLLKRIETTGFITRMRDPEDERRVVISLTDQGRALESKSGDIRSCIIDNTGLGMEDLLQLKSMIYKLRTAMPGKQAR